MPRVLFVCTGNTCRSSMAEAIARHWLEQEGHADVEAISAGIAAFPGSPAATNAILALGRMGIDLRSHRAQQVTPEMVAGADLVLTMTRDQRDYLRRLSPEHADKIFLLKEYGWRGWAKSSEARQRLAGLEQRIQEQIEEFLEVHGEAMRKLIRQRNELKEKLRQVENELLLWEKRLEQVTAPARKALEKAERELLKELEISDPIGSSAEEYWRCAQEIKDSTTIALRRFLEEAEPG